MAIVDTITNDYALWEALQKTDGYKNNFTIEGAKALQAYMEELSEETGEDIEFDPIVWCIEYTEYKNLREASKQYDGYFSEGQSFEDYTEIIEFDGGVILRDF